MSDQRKVTGGCMCGAVRYKVIEEPLYVSYCHCHSCRRHTGAPVVAFVVFDDDKVHFDRRDRSIFNSSPGTRRGFCDQCGTPLTCEGQVGEQKVIGFYISTFDDPGAYVPDRHYRHEERIAWFDVADDLPRYLGGGTGEKPYRHGPVTEGPFTGRYSGTPPK